MERKFESFISIFIKAAEEYPDKLAVVMENQTRTYGDIFEHARRIAGYLKQSGIGKGDPVAIISSNHVDYVETVLGCAMAGAITVKINWRFAAPELHYLLFFNHVKYIFFRSQDENIRREMGELTASLCPSLDMDIMEERLKDAEPICRFEEYGDKDVLMHLHTSGTTGFPKVVRYANGEFLRELESCVGSLGFARDTIYQLMSQLFHSASMGTYACLACGGTVVIFSRFDPAKYMASVEKYKVNRLSAIPTVLTALLGHPDFGRYDLSSIRMISYSTCPMPPELILRARKKFHCEFQQSYGMTEMCSIVTILSAGDHFCCDMRYLNSVGKPIAGHQVRIVDEDGRPCKAGEIGEICARGPGMMLDYYQMPEETQESIRDGWYHTRDVGYLDGDGYLYVRGRKNDMIISGGENIFPLEVEHALLMHPDIPEASVMGIRDAYWGEAVHAFVTLKCQSTLTGQDIRDFCRGKIAGYKIPKQVHICKSLPRTATGKVMKAELKKQVETGVTPHGMPPP